MKFLWASMPFGEFKKCCVIHETNQVCSLAKYERREE